MYRTQLRFLSSGCSTDKRVRLRVPQVENAPRSENGETPVAKRCQRNLPKGDTSRIAVPVNWARHLPALETNTGEICGLLNESHTMELSSKEHRRGEGDDEYERAAEQGEIFGNENGIEHGVGACQYAPNEQGQFFGLQ